MWNRMSGLDKDDLLELVGLKAGHRADFVLPALGLFGVGLLVGAGLGLLLAPKPGAQLRDELRHRLGSHAQEPSGRYPAVSGTEAIIPGPV